LDQRAYAQPAALLPCGDRCGQHSDSSRWLHRRQHYHLGGSQCRWRRLRKSYAYGESIGHIDADSYTNCDGNRYAYADSYAYCHSNTHGYTYSYAYCDSNSYAYADTYADGYDPAETKPDTKAATSDAAASPVSGSGRLIVDSS